MINIKNKDQEIQGLKKRIKEAEKETALGKQLEKKFIESEVRYRRLFESAQDAILILDAVSGEVVDANPFVENLLGYPVDGLLGRQIWQISPLKNVARNKKKFLELQKQKYVRYHDLPLQTRSGNPIHVEFVSNVYMVDGARVIQCNIRDITERKQAEKTRRSESDRLKKFINIAGVMILTLDKNGNITLINQRGTEILGYDQEDILGKSWFDHFVPATIKEQVKTVFHQVMTGKIEAVEYYENAVVIKGGEERIVAWNNTILKDEDGNITGTLSSGEDITERKKSEAELRESEERFRTIFNNAMDGMLLADTQTKHFCMANEIMCNMLGYTEEEMTGLTVEDIHPADALPQVIEAFKKQMRKEQAIAENIPVLRKNGSVFYADVNSSPLRLGNKEYLFGIFRDVTDRRRAEAELIEYRDHLEDSVKQRTAELVEKNTELERFHDATVGREFRMQELRERNEELEKKLKEKK